MDISGFPLSLRWPVVALAVALLTATPVFALPEDAPPAGLLIKVETSGRLRAGQEAELVYLQDVSVSGVERFTSSSGRTHLTFTLDTGEQAYAGIMYDGEWTETDEARLASGAVDLVGLWGEYGGMPSLTTKWVESLNDTQARESPQDDGLESREDLVLIEGATVSDVNKFVSSSFKMHVRFSLKSPRDDRVFSGIAYEGAWNSDTLAALRSGSANLIGYWDDYQGEPSFVLQGLE